MMRGSQTAHIDELVRAAAERNSRRDAVIHDSWLRCVTEHKLDPSVLREARILPQAQLREHRDAMDEFLHTARFGVETLYRQVSGLGYVLLLTDANGVTVDFMGDPTFDNHCRRAGLYLGSDWNETHAGTCAVGTCIMTGDALTVHQTDHFDATHIPLTCTAAPIYDPSGNMAAVLDISALRSPEPKASQLLAQQLVVSFANKIETANLLNRFRNEWILRLAHSPEFADVDPYVVIAVDASGRVIGVNNQARILLNEEAPASDPSRPPRALFISDIFECTVDDFPFYIHSRPSEQRGLRLRRSGSTLFGRALPPPPKKTPGPAQRERPLPAELAALAGEDDAMRSVLSRAAKLVNTQMGLLINGETGTGKEHLTKALHNVSPRAGKPFIAVNCAALPDGLIESELFGYEAGSFTGAKAKGKKGLVLEANGGTLFLDEIGEMPLELQPHFLRVLEDGEVYRVGENKPRKVHVRVIAATNRNLRDEVAQGRFRMDLFYRLAVATLRLPSLTDHREDIPTLARHFIEQTARTHKVPMKSIDAGVIDALLAYSWPGNIRELRNVIEGMTLLAEGDRLTFDDLPPELTGVREPSQTVTSAAFLDGPPPLRLADRERQAIIDAIEAEHGNLTRVASRLGIAKSTLYEKVKRYGISRIEAERFKF